MEEHLIYETENRKRWGRSGLPAHASVSAASKLFRFNARAVKVALGLLGMSVGVHPVCQNVRTPRVDSGSVFSVASFRFGSDACLAMQDGAAVQAGTERFEPKVQSDGSVILPVRDEKNPQQLSDIWTFQGSGWSKTPGPVDGTPVASLPELPADVLSSAAGANGTAITKKFRVTSEMKALSFRFIGSGSISQTNVSLLIDGRQMNMVGPESAKMPTTIRWDLSKYVGKDAQLLMSTKGGWVAFLGDSSRKTEAGSEVARAPSGHVRTLFAKRIRVTMQNSVSAENMDNGLLKIIAPVASNTSNQKLVSCLLQCVEYPDLPVEKVPDDRDPQRSWLWIKFRLEQPYLRRPVTIRVTYVLDMYDTKILPGASTGRVEKLSAEERKANLAIDQTFDWDRPEFQKYLDKLKIRIRLGEDKLSFAHRAYRVICAEIASRTIPTAKAVPFDNCRASYLCLPENDNSGCANCSTVFTAAMRANGLPAQLWVGRWATTKESRPDAYGMEHVKSAVYVDDVGWIPVDATFGMGAIQQGKDCDEFFGGDQGGFITLHLNTGLHPVDPDLDRGFAPMCQGIIFSYVGKSPISWTCKWAEPGWVIEKLSSR